MSVGEYWSIGRSWFLTLLVFLAGCLASYLATQFEFFDLNYEINVTESLIDLGTLAVGLYLGITINSRFNNKQHFIHFIEPKLEDVWKKANDLRNLIESNNSIDNTSLSKQVKALNIVIAQLSNVFKIFGKESKCIDDIDNSVDALESAIQASPTNNNIYDYSQNLAAIIALIDNIDSKIIVSFNILHSK